ncbi:MAG: hypothetical protein K2L10_09125 [Ruminococcus sp.]|nr:hypothetical protein [Ruminococcus sp.]
MNNDEKDFMENLSDLDEEAVEEIAEDYPVLDEYAKNRILRKCLRKSGLSDDDIEVMEDTEVYEDDVSENDDYEDETSVSGIERYDHPLWSRYVSSVAVMAIAVVGIASVIALHGNLNSVDDFDISSPPVVSNVVTTTDESIQRTEIVTGSYIDRGYKANGFDFANENDYHGIVVGTTAVTEIVDSGEVTDITESSENANNEYVTEQNIQPTATAPPETAPPTVPQTAPPATEAPPATTLTVTEIQTVPPATEVVTTTAQTEVQKTFLNGLYYVENSVTNEYMGFEFTPEGTLTKYNFDKTGNVISGTMIVTNYEITDNQFFFVDSQSGFNMKSGTIVNPNDTENFSVQFADSLYNFSRTAPEFETERITLDGEWYGDSSYGLRIFDFYDNINGSFSFVYDTLITNFSYTIENNHINFKFTDGTSDGDIIRDYDGEKFTVLWDDGNVEYFYNEKVWSEMNQ